MPDHKTVRTHLLAVIVASMAALIFRSWIQVEMRSAGMQNDYAADLSYLVVPPVLAILLFPIWRGQRAFLAGLFKCNALTVSLALKAVAIGFLLRLAEWSQLIAGVSFGWYRNTDPAAVTGPTFSFGCPDANVLILGIVVMVMIVPLVEETIHRGLIQSWLEKQGAVVAIGASALLFMLAHRPSTWDFAFLAGIVLGIQYWRARSLWPSLITHATLNGLIQLDWRCVRGQWNPPATELPMWGHGILGTLGLLGALILVGILLRKIPGCAGHPGNRPSQRVRDPLDDM